MKIFGRDFDEKKVKKIVYTAGSAVLALWFVYRFVMFGLEKNMNVFNPAREVNASGILVEVTTAYNNGAIIKVPIAIKNNRGYVSNSNHGQIKPGQKVGNGEIVSVSGAIDLDSGMHVVRTRGAADGLNMIEIKTNGYCVPTYAVRDDKVYVVESGVAVARQVVVSGFDSEVTCISDGITDGDKVILSRVSSGQKVKIQD